MTTPLEQDLDRALAVAADAAPPPNVDFLAGVERRHRARRRRRVTGATAAVALAVAGTLGAVNLPVRHRPPVTVTVTPTPSVTKPVSAPDFAHLRPADEVWPQAVRTLPVTLPDGRPYTVAAALGGDRYILRADELVTVTGTGSVGEVSIAGGDLFVHDLRARTTTLLGDPMPAGWRSESVTVNDGVVAWVRGKYPDYEVWTWRGAGAPTVAASAVTSMLAGPRWAVAAGDRVYWSDRNMRNAPLAGGPVVTDREIGESTPGSWAPISGEWVRLAYFAPGHERMYNFVTGEHFRQDLEGRAQRMACTRSWCAGVTDKIVRFGAQRLDGSGFVESNVSGNVYAQRGLGGRIVLGRVSIFAESKPLGRDTVVPFAWDLETGRAGAIDALPTRSGQPMPGYTDLTALEIGTTNAGQHRIVDLTLL
jgi:hypothetical protein